jgi:hypothetical protein
VEILVYIISALLAVFGLVFLVGSQGMILRFVLGGILLVAAGVLIYIFRSKPKTSQTTIVQKIDLSGDVEIEHLKCNACGGQLGKDSVEVKAGAIFINCAYCHASYQIEEEPKW